MGLSLHIVYMYLPFSPLGQSLNEITVNSIKTRLRVKDWEPPKSRTKLDLGEEDMVGGKFQTMLQNQ